MKYFLTLLLLSFRFNPGLVSLYFFLTFVFSTLDIIFLFLLSSFDFSDITYLFSDEALPKLYLLLLLAFVFLFRIVRFYLALALARSISVSLNHILLKNFLTLPLSHFLPSGPKELSHIMSIESDIFYEGVLYPLFISTQIILSLASLLISLLIINQYLFIFVVLLGVFVGLVLFKYLLPPLRSLSGKVSTIRTDFSLKIIQFFENIDFLRSTNSGGNYLIPLESSDFLYKTYSSYGFLVGLAPKSFLESFVPIVLLLITIVFATLDTNFSYIPLFFSFLFSAAFILQRLISSTLILGMSFVNLETNRGRCYSYINLLSKYVFDKSNIISPQVTQEISSSEWNSISLHNLSMNYDNTIINIGNFKIYRGQRIGITGPSGSGKSTFLKILLGTEYPSSGTLLIDGTKVDFSQLLHLSSPSFQKPFFLFNTILDNITSTPNALLDIAQSKFFKDTVHVCGLQPIIDKYGLDSPIGEYCSSLSGGQQLRLSIARALFSKASIIILDEPTSALDVDSSHTLFSRLKHFFPSLTLIIVSHTIEDFSLCDIIYLKPSLDSSFIISNSD